MVTRAPATGFPDGSVTIPESAAPVSCARRGREIRNRSAAPVRISDRSAFQPTRRRVCNLAARTGGAELAYLRWNGPAIPYPASLRNRSAASEGRRERSHDRHRILREPRHRGIKAGGG